MGKDNTEILNNTIIKIKKVLEENQQKNGNEEAYKDIQKLVKKRNI